jgi:hypothetical protein
MDLTGLAVGKINSSTNEIKSYFTIKMKPKVALIMVKLHVFTLLILSHAVKISDVVQVNCLKLMIFLYDLDLFLNIITLHSLSLTNHANPSLLVSFIICIHMQFAFFFISSNSTFTSSLQVLWCCLVQGWLRNQVFFLFQLKYNDLFILD